MDAETLTFLLDGGHLNMEERIKRGLWPHPPLKFDDVLRHLVRVLKTGRRFPSTWQPAVPGERVFWSAKAAARHYLKWDLRLPGRLDGWEVIP